MDYIVLSRHTHYQEHKGSVNKDVLLVISKVLEV